MRLICFVICLILLGTNGSAQTFRHYTSSEGAPIGSVMGIAQDQIGFMWFATTGGVYRFDSKEFKHYIANKSDSLSLSSDYANGILVDSKNRVWVATEIGISLLDRERDNFIRFKNDSGNSESLSGNKVTCIFEDTQQRVWVGTSNGINLVENQEGNQISFRRIIPSDFNSDYSNVIKTIKEGKNKDLWIGTSKGILHIDSDFKIIAHYLPKSSSLLSQENDVVALHCYSDRQIWVGTSSGGFQIFNSRTGEFEEVPSFYKSAKGVPRIADFVLDDDGSMWVPTWSGLANVDVQTFRTTWFRNQPSNSFSLIDDTIYSLFKDNNEGLWVGTYYNGVSYFNPQTRRFNQFLAPELSPDNVHMIDGSYGLSEDGIVWVVSDLIGKIRLFDENYQSIASYKVDLPSVWMYNRPYLDREKVLWYPGFGVVSSYNLLTQKRNDFYLPEKWGGRGIEFERILLINEEEYWVIGPHGLFKFNKKTGGFLETELKQPLICMKSDNKSMVWIGGKGKIYSIDRKDKLREYQLSNIDDELPNVWKIDIDDRGRIWALTLKQLWLYNAVTDQFEEFKLSIDVSYWSDLVCDQKGGLWLSSSELIYINPDSGYIEKFEERDGLPSKGALRVGSAFVNRKGDLVFFTNKGPFTINPSSLNIDDRKYPIVMTGLKLFNKSVQINDETGILKREFSTEKSLSLRYDQNFIALDFALLSFEKSDLHQFAYKLEGIDNKWNYVSKPTANYTNLPPGVYTFYVKAANAKGNWTEETKMLIITVSPPWWRTWYAYIGYLVLLVLVGYRLLQFLWKRNTQKREHEMYLGKIDFLTNVAHEIRTHLLLISAPLEKAILKTEPTSESMSFLQRTQKSADMLRVLVSDLLDFRKLENGKQKLFVAEHNISYLIKYIVGVYEHIAESKGITTIVTLPKEDIFGWVDKSQFQKVISNLLHNAYKFTPEGGEVKVEVFITQYDIFILITDNGMGIKPEYLSKLFTNFFQVDETLGVSTGYGIGLALSRQIIQIHHGDLRVRSIVAGHGQNGSTSFTIRLKRGKEHFATDELINQAVFSNEGVFLPIQNTYDREIGIHLQGTQYTLLLIEDNEELRDFMYVVFKPQFRVLTANTGLEGVRLAKDRVPDIIISDIMMPEMNGIELCKQLKSSLETSHIPIILASAKGATKQIVDGLASGADDYFVKPFDINILELKIQNILKTQQAFRGRYQQNSWFETPKTETIEDPFVEKLRATVLENISERNFGVNEIAAEVGMSVSVLYRKLRAITGYTVNDFIKMIRINESANLIKTEQYSIVEVAMLVGYEDAKYFSREFKKAFGCTPSKYMRKSNLDSVSDIEDDE